MKRVFLILIGPVVLVGAIIFYSIITEPTLEDYTQPIEIVFGETMESLNPYTLVTGNDLRLRLIYEPLVVLDENLSVKPALARKFGKLDELEWSFELHPEAKYHDGQNVTSHDVQTIFTLLKDVDAFQSLVGSIDSIVIKDDKSFIIKTKYFDPVLLNKLSLIPITPVGILSELEREPNGSGPYKIKTILADALILERNENYYLKKPQFLEIKLSTILDPDIRASYVKNNEKIALVYPFPFSNITDLEKKDFELKRGNLLAVNFFLFNMNQKLWTDPDIRRIFIDSLDTSKIQDLIQDLGHPINQFVASGVTGFNRELGSRTNEKKNIIQEITERKLKGVNFNIAMLEGLENFRIFLENQWKEVGLVPVINLMTFKDITNPDLLAKHHLIFLGFKSDYADSSQFIADIAKTDAQFNLGHYSNAEVDELLTQSESEEDIRVRQSYLEEVMNILTNEDPIGIPLFESEILYALNRKFEYTPRADGFLDIFSLKVK